MHYFKDNLINIVFFLGVKILTIVGSDQPLDNIRSSGQELIIKFKSYSIKGPFRMNNTQATFLMSYETDYISNLIYIYIGYSVYINHSMLIVQ